MILDAVRAEKRTPVVQDDQFSEPTNIGETFPEIAQLSVTTFWSFLREFSPLEVSELPVADGACPCRQHQE
jgi:hypothetical protein